MANSVRRRNVKRTFKRNVRRNESRNQRVNRLNQKRRRKGRKTLLNKKKRRVSRRKSNRRKSNKRKVSRRSNRRRIVGGGPWWSCSNKPKKEQGKPKRGKIYEGAREAWPAETDLDLAQQRAAAAAAAATASTEDAVAAGAPPHNLRIIEARRDPQRWPFHPEGDIYEVKGLYSGVKIIQYVKHGHSKPMFLNDLSPEDKAKVTPPIVQVNVVVYDLFGLSDLVQELKSNEIIHDHVKESFGPGSPAEGGSMRSATQPFWMMESLRYNIYHARDMNHLKRIVDGSSNLDRYTFNGEKHAQCYDDSEKGRVLGCLHCGSVRLEILKRIGREFSYYHGHKYLKVYRTPASAPAPAPGPAYKRDIKISDIKFDLWVTSNNLLMPLWDEAREALDKCWPQ